IALTQSFHNLRLPDDARIRLVVANALRSLAVMDGGKPVALRRLTAYALLAIRDLRPYSMPLEDFARIELHDAFIDRVWQSRSDVGSNEVIDPGYCFRVALRNHDLQLVVHVNGVFAHDARSLELPQVSKTDGCCRCIPSRRPGSPKELSPG